MTSRGWTRTILTSAPAATRRGRPSMTSTGTRRVALVAAVALAVAACGTATTPPPTPPTAAVSRALKVGKNPAPAPPDVRTSFERRVERFVLRVRGVGCGGEWLGSGFAISPNQFITNRHVVAGADERGAATDDRRAPEAAHG